MNEVTRRLRGAAYFWAAVTDGDPPTGRELAEAVSAAVRPDRPYTQQAANGWWNGTMPPDEVILALAGMFGVTAGWLRYGEGEAPWARPFGPAARAARAAAVATRDESAQPDRQAKGE